MSLLENRFRTVAVSTGAVTLDQLQEGLHVQVAEDVAGKPHRLIGTILQDLGYLDEAQVARVLVTLRND